MPRLLLLQPCYRPQSQLPTVRVIPSHPLSLLPFTAFAGPWLSQRPVQPVVQVAARWTGWGEARDSVHPLLTAAHGADSDTHDNILPSLALTQTKQHRTATHCTVLTHHPHRAENIPKGNLAINTAKNKKTHKTNHQINQTEAEMSENLNKQKSQAPFDFFVAGSPH